MDRGPSRNQQRKTARRLATQQRVETARVERVVRSLREFGIFTLAAAGVSLTLLPEAFLYLVLFVYVAIPLWAAERFFELREYSQGLRVIPLVVGLTLAGIFSQQFVFARLPLSAYVWSTGGAYQAGSVVNGIQWNAKFNDIHVVLSNDSDHDYAQVDLLVRPRQPVVAAALVTAFPVASISRVLPMTSFDLQLFHQATGTRTDIPFEWFASTTGYRLHCDYLPQHSRIELLMALARINQKVVDLDAVHIAGPWGFGRNGQLWWRWQNFALYDDVFSSRPSDLRVKIKGQYVAFYRRNHLKETVSASAPMTDFGTQASKGLRQK